MVSEGKEKAIQHLSRADLAFIAVLLDVQGGLAFGHNNALTSYRLRFENISVIRGYLGHPTDQTHFHYHQSSKGFQFRIADETDEQIQQAAEDDEVKEPKEGQTYAAILNSPEEIDVLIEINPHDISEIIQSIRK